MELFERRGVSTYTNLNDVTRQGAVFDRISIQIESMYASFVRETKQEINR